jgi:hypothetical protein
MDKRELLDSFTKEWCKKNDLIYLKKTLDRFLQDFTSEISHKCNLCGEEFDEE